MGGADATDEEEEEVKYEDEGVDVGSEVDVSDVCDVIFGGERRAALVVPTADRAEEDDGRVVTVGP